MSGLAFSPRDSRTDYAEYVSYCSGEQGYKNSPWADLTTVGRLASIWKCPTGLKVVNRSVQICKLWVTSRRSELETEDSGMQCQHGQSWQNVHVLPITFTASSRILVAKLMKKFHTFKKGEASFQIPWCQPWQWATSRHIVSWRSVLILSSHNFFFSLFSKFSHRSSSMTWKCSSRHEAR